MYNSLFRERAIKIYRWLISLYPSQYQDSYADDMVATFNDVLEEAEYEKGWVAMLGILLLSFFDTIGQVLKEQFTYVRNKGRYMAELQIANPVRGFRRFFWTITTVCLLISAISGTEFYAKHLTDSVEILLGLFFVFTVVLLIRSKRGWPVASLIVVLGITSGFMVALLATQIVANVFMSSRFEAFLQIHPYWWSLFSDILQVVYSGSFLLVGFLLVREVEQPRLSKMWERLEITKSSHGADKAWRLFWVSLLSIFLLITILFFSFNREIILHHTQADYLEMLNALSGALGRFYAFSVGYVVGLLGVISLILTVLLSWIFTKRNFAYTAIITGVYVGSVLGCGIATQYLVLPTVPTFSSGGGVEQISDSEGRALLESCALKESQEWGQSLDEARRSHDLQGNSPANVTTDLCTKVTTPHREGNLYFDGGYGSSMDAHQGAPTDFILTGEKLPPIAAISLNPLFLLSCAWLMAFVVPVVLTLIVAASLRRRVVNGSNKN